MRLQLLLLLIYLRLISFEIDRGRGSARHGWRTKRCQAGLPFCAARGFCGQSQHAVPAHGVSAAEPLLAEPDPLTLSQARMNSIFFPAQRGIDLTNLERQRKVWLLQWLCKVILHRSKQGITDGLFVILAAPLAQPQ